MYYMTNQLIELQLPTDYTEDDLKREIRIQSGVSDFTYKIDLKSLDARKKDRIHWNIRARVYNKSDEETGNEEEQLMIPGIKTKKKVTIAGSGPAGFFAGYVLLLAGFDVSIFEKGPETAQRYTDVKKFEETGFFTPNSNYAHGEGGAGTFSDGKLTSRTKNISKEKRFVLETYVKGGAPDEIMYLAKPHIGSDNLRRVIPTLRNMFSEMGGDIRFNEPIIDFETKGEKSISISTPNRNQEVDILIFAPGHSSFETYRMLMKKGISFEPKPFAIGVRVEHPQKIINKSQWGVEKLPGIKAADYKLTCSTSANVSVYSFCMCPGGYVVPANPELHLSIVNGVSDYMRDSSWANAGIVAGISLSEITGKSLTAIQCLEYLEKLEENVYKYREGTDIPANNIKDFIDHKVCRKFPDTSFPFPLYPSDFMNFLPQPVIIALREGLIDFSRKIRGFDQGIMMGLESKTSAPVRALRDENGNCAGFSNIYVAGEGSGYSGGIVSSAVDGIRIGMKIISRYV